jgi:CHAD domain-containing protein
MKIAWDPSKSTVENAREVLPRLTERFFAAGRKAVKKPKKLRSLHRFRIQTKGFRYALEIFQPLYGPAFQSRLDALKQIQQYLGDINDSANTRQLLDRTMLGDGFLAKELHQSLGTTERQKVRKLVEYWQKSFDAAGEEEKWMRYLNNYAGRAKGNP